MRIDPDVLRDLVLKLESYPMRASDRIVINIGDEIDRDDPFFVDGYSADEIEFHLQHILDQGFTIDEGSHPMRGITFNRLSPRGVDFANNVREPKAWAGAKSRAGQVGGWTVGFLADLAKGYLKAEAGKHGFPLA